jgi:hypothetical protein
VLAVHAVVQDQERDAEHRERVFRAQVPAIVDVHIQPLSKPVHSEHGQLGGLRVDVGQVMP